MSIGTAQQLQTHLKNHEVSLCHCFTVSVLTEHMGYDMASIPGHQVATNWQPGSSPNRMQYFAVGCNTVGDIWFITNIIEIFKYVLSNLAWCELTAAVDPAKTCRLWVVDGQSDSWSRMWPRGSQPSQAAWAGDMKLITKDGSSAKRPAVLGLIEALPSLEFVAHCKLVCATPRADYRNRTIPMSLAEYQHMCRSL